MPLETVRLTAVLPATADRVYAAWLDSSEHMRMTGGKASVDPQVGGEHSAWDGYITGKTLELEPGRRIVQSWRTTDFPLGAADSRLEVHLLDVGEGSCEITIIHTEIPEGQGAKYESGWQGHYLEPMQKYFGKPARAKPAAKKAGKKKPPAKKAPAKKVKKAAASKKVASKKVAKKGARKAARKRAAKKGRKK
jgi:uncharacterized protein YndB with AHSA1/START domain